MDKEGLVRVKYSLLISVVSILVLLMYFGFAAHTTTTSEGGTSYSVNEDEGFIYNISVNNTDIDITGNISEVNITLPSGFSFIFDSNGTNTGAASHIFLNVSVLNLSWSNDAGIVRNATAINFWFNATASTPGMYNLTVTTRNASTTTTSYIDVTVNDTTFPLLNLTYPLNLTYSTDVSNLNYTYSDLYPGSCWYSLNDGGANTSITCGVNASSLVSTEGSNTWRIWVNDSAGNTNSSSITFFKDTVAPNISYGGAATTTGNYSQTWVLINVTADDSGVGLESLSVTLYNASWDSQSSTFAAGSSNVTLNVTSLANGVYYLNSTVNDSLNNINRSMQTIILDTTGPAVNFTSSPLAGSNYSGNLLINASISDALLSVNTIFFNVTNSSGKQVNISTASQMEATNYWNATLNTGAFADGAYNITVYANDSANNLNSSVRVQFNIDNTAPLISYGTGTPGAGEYLAQQNIYINISASDSLAGISSINVTLYNASWTAKSSTLAEGSANVTLNVTSLDAGAYYLNVSANDTVGNINLTTTRIIYLKDYWTFNGTVYDTAGSVLNGTIVNVTIWTMGEQGPALNLSVAATSNESGQFSVDVPRDSNWMYRPVVRHFNSTNGAIDYIGQSLPQFPYQDFANTTNLRFYLKDAGTINITALNSTGTGRTVFNYMIKDTLLGYDVASNWQSYVSEAIIYVPRDRNYSIMVYPNRSMPVSFNWNNFSSNSSYEFSYSSSYNVTTHTLQKTFNTTETLAVISGQIQKSGVNGWDELTVVPFLIEPGNIVSKQHGTLPYNISSWNETAYSDIYDLTGGNYSITLPAPAETGYYLLFATARNGTGYYGGYRNISTSYGDETNSVNFTMYPLMSTAWASVNGNLSLNSGMGEGVNISSAQQALNIINSSNATLSDLNAHIEIKLDYSRYNATEFTFMYDVSTGTNSIVYLPLLNVTGIKEINIYTQGYAPKRKSFSASEILQNNNVTLSAFNPGGIDEAIGSGSINIGMYISNSTCDIPSPSGSCTIGSSDQNMSSFNPLSAIIGGGKISFRMGYGNISVHYVNVDMLASGPPDAMFDSNTTTGTSSNFESALRFGSQGPKIYDYVLVSLPYIEGSSLQTGLNESAPVNLSIPVLYDDSWRVIWNASANGTSAAGLAGNYSHYSDHQSEWGTLLSSSVCIAEISLFNATNPCYIDNSSNKIWVRLPHFSGTGPKAIGEIITAESVATTTTTSSTSSSSSGGTIPFWTSTIYEDNKALSERGPIIKEIGAKTRIIVKINGAQHSVGITNLTSNSATVNVSSVSQQAKLIIGESKKFDVELDGYYDLRVILNSISNNKANLTVESISEKVITASGGDREVSEENEEQVSNTESGQEEDTILGEISESKTVWIWALVVILLAVAIFLVLRGGRNKRLKRAGLR